MDITATACAEIVGMGQLENLQFSGFLSAAEKSLSESYPTAQKKA